MPSKGEGTSTLDLPLSKVTIGDPSVESVRMGALAGIPQVMEVSQKVEQLSQSHPLYMEI